MGRTIRDCRAPPDRPVRIAVTGASGFIGGHVLAALAARGEREVTAVCRTPPAALPAGNRHDALDLRAADADSYARIGSPDLLIHLAWDGLPNYRSLHHFEDELPLQYRFLRAMVEAGLPSMLATGTCYEYGMVDGALAEDAEPRPDNPYGFAKASLLRQLTFLQTQHAFALTWARLFYTWGAGQGARSLYPLLRAAAARGDQRFPMSQGDQLRDYLPVATIADIIVALALGGHGHGVVNISSGEPVSVRALVERWIAAEGLTIVPELGRYPYPDHEPMAFWGSSDKRRRLLG